MKEAFRIVRDKGGLDISGEYGSLDIQDNDFEVDPKMNLEPNKDNYEPSAEYRAKEAAMPRVRPKTKKPSLK